jgi:hypothetical protein
MRWVPCPYCAPALGTIHGIVTVRKDKNTAKPIKGAKGSAQCKGLAEKNTRTDDSECYALTDLEEGSNLQCVKYRSKSKKERGEK